MEAFRSMLLNAGAKDIAFSTYRRQKLENEQQGLGMEAKSEENEREDPMGDSDMVGLVVRRSLIQKKSLLYLVLGILFLLIIAFILGYISSRRSCKACEEIGLPSADNVISNNCDYQRDVDINPDPVLYWGDLTAMLKKYVNQEDITKHIRMMSEEPHPSGSAKLHELTTTIHKEFNSYGLHHVWADSHYVSLPFPDSSSPNYLRVTNVNGTILEKVTLDNEAYFAYSPSGVVSGGLVYAHYGRDEDFVQLEDRNVAVQGNIVILRAGRISLAEKVANAEQCGATGVLIYPDPSDYPQNPRDRGLHSNTCISGHVHHGTGDPFTPGFPSFNHTQFPPVNSSALPTIVALPISASAAFTLMSKLRGQKAPTSWRGKLPHVTYNLGPDLENPGDQLQFSVSSRMVPTMISNVFGSIDGFSEPDRYIIFGAQRDAWSKGAAKSGVGTAILLELAHAFSQMVANGFRPRRSLLFASWDAGEFGSVGATEWLEGYLTMMHLKAAAYFSLDKTVLGNDRLHTESSPLLYNLIDAMIKQISNSPRDSWQFYKEIVIRDFGSTKTSQPLTMESSAYPFTAFAGVPAMELSFRQLDQDYPFLNTVQDTYEALNNRMKKRLADVCQGVVEMVGQMALELTFNDRLHLSYAVYSDVILTYINQFQTFAAELKSRGLTLQWLYSARGDFNRAAERLNNLISTSTVDNEALNRVYNDKIMRVEFYFLSQYVSATDVPFRHILHGRGDHTLDALYRHFQLLQTDPTSFDENRFRKQLALVTWTLQGAANALSGDVWNIDNNSF